MKFREIEFSEDNSTVTFKAEANNQEIAFLVDFAINRLLAEGVIALNPDLGEEQDVWILQ